MAGDEPRIIEQGRSNDIVRESHGRLTGERIFVTRDGTRWTTELPKHLSTGDRIGRVSDGRIYDAPDWW